MPPRRDAPCTNHSPSKVVLVGVHVLTVWCSFKPSPLVILSGSTSRVSHVPQRYRREHEL